MTEVGNKGGNKGGEQAMTPILKITVTVILESNLTKELLIYVKYSDKL